MFPTSVSPLLWQPNFATGVPEIDEQHMILVHTLNEASSKLARDASLETIEKITQDLLSYALYHFETEEELMQEYGYVNEDSQLHLEQHRLFSERVVRIREDLKSARPVPANELVEFLSTWLTNHILNTDKRLGAFIVERRREEADLDPVQAADQRAGTQGL